MQDKIVTLTEKLITFKSVPTDPTALEEILDYVISEVKGFTVERFESNGYKSVLIYNTPTRPKKFKVILNGHLDIIPGKDFQYKPEIKNGRIYGVASIDMKSSVAAFIVVFKEIAKDLNYPVALQFVTDEELGGFHGTKYQIDQGVRADFVLVGETTNFMIENQAKGIAWIKVRNKGKTAHGAYPWKGKNALWDMNEFLNNLAKRFPLPKKKQWITTVNFANIETSNKTFNKIPDDCEVWLDIRYIPEDSETVVKAVKELLPKGFTMEVPVKEPAQYVDPNNPYMKQLQKIGKTSHKKNITLNQGQGSSDARHYTRVKNAAIEFGPEGTGMGTDDEWVDIKSLGIYADILKDFLLSLNK